MSAEERQGGRPQVGTSHAFGRAFPTQAKLSKHLLDAHEDGAEGGGAASSSSSN